MCPRPKALGAPRLALFGWLVPQRLLSINSSHGGEGLDPADQEIHHEPPAGQEAVRECPAAAGSLMQASCMSQRAGQRIPADGHPCRLPALPPAAGAGRAAPRPRQCLQGAPRGDRMLAIGGWQPRRCRPLAAPGALRSSCVCLQGWQQETGSSGSSRSGRIMQAARGTLCCSAGSLRATRSQPQWLLPVPLHPFCPCCL